MKNIRFIVAIVYAGFIFYLSSRTWCVSTGCAFQSYIAHFVVYAGLAGVVLWALRTTRLKGNENIILIAAVISTLYGVTDEIHQYFVPGREYSYLDMLTNAIGSLFGAWAALKVARKLRKENFPSPL